jgi:RHS repeat-associated protein
MGSQANGGIVFNSAAVAGQKYLVKPGAPSGAPSGTSYGSMPVNYVTWFSAARFVNWLSNGQQASAASMETGTYTLNNAVSGSIIARNSNATVFLPSADEWHKAAFFDGSAYKTHATNSNSTPTATVSDFSLTNAGNFAGVVGMPLNVGSYVNTVSAYGLYDMFGNVNEITDTPDGSGQFRAMGGGYAGNTTAWTSAASGIFQAGTFGSQAYGFRVAASAPVGVSISYATIGNPGNTGNTGSSPAGMGAVADTFRMGTTEVTNAQYVAFLNSVDASGVNPRSVYDSNMGSQANGGITFDSGAAAGQKYSVKSGAPSGAPSGTSYGSMPVNYVTWFSAARFVNWLSNGQQASAASMETGTYTLNNAVSGSIIARNSNATVFLPSADEWHKAGFYDGSGYKTHATNSNSTPTATVSDFSLTNAGNFSSVAGMPLNVGSYVNTVSAYGLYDMFGNVNEITDTADGSGQFRAMGGGYGGNTTGWTSTASGVFQASTFANQSYGFRVASSAAVGDLVSITVRDASSVPLDTSFYRYGEGPSGKRLLQYIFDNDAVRRATAASIDLMTAANNVVAPFATSYLEYDAEDRIVRHDLQGAGCSTCNGGIGSFEYAYEQNPATGLYRSAWHTKTTETRPDGTERIVYANGRLQTMLEVIRTNDGGTPKQYGTYTRYDSRGNPIWQVSPEAVLLPADLTDLEQYPDLLNAVDGNFEFISDSSGLIEVTSYFVGTTASATTAGSADRFVSSTSVHRGETGTPILQSSFTYFVQSEGGSSDTRVATRTSYVTTDGTESNTTTYAYTYATGTTQIVSQTTTFPVVTTSQNGSNSADVTERFFDSAGRTIWSKDADGFLRYTEYDEQTGSVIKTIVDVDTAQTSSFENLPSGWATPTGGGLHLVSSYEVDNLGRTTKSTDPNGSITYTVYDDLNHAVRTYAGWNSVTGRPTGPTQLSRRDLSGTYTESLTFSAAPDLDASGRPTGTEAITSIESLSRSIMNAAGQVVATDRYVLIPTYSTATATLGSAGTNYLRTTYAYDDQGRVDRMVNPAGTITLHFHDGLGRQVATYVGTDDSTTDTLKWTPENASTSSNMTLIATQEYDYGGVGNGNLTSTTQYPGGSADPRTTEYAFDWRNRLVITKAGATDAPGSEDSSVNRPLTYTDYDNLGRAIAQSVYDGDGVSILAVNTDGVPDKPSAGLLRASQTSAFDSRGRVYQSEQLLVDQSSGAIGTPTLTTDTFYDARGHVAMVMAPNGPVSQYRYDGAGRMTFQLTLGNIPGATLANATSLTDSVVLEQVGFEYDPAGNTILTTIRERFHDASTSTTGLLGTPTTGIPARVSYVASYYDVGHRLTDSVNVGTNGGTAYTRPGTVPSRSDTVLVTSYDYDDAGRVQDVTDPMGIITRTTYDLLGRTVASILNYTGGSPGAQSDVTTTFQFDSSGRLASRTAVQPTGTPSQVTGYVYGVSVIGGSTITSNDLMAETRYPDRVTGLPSTTDRDLYTANALGERTSFTDRAGTTHGYIYNILGRQTADVITVLGSGVDGSIRRVEMAHDTFGSVSLVTTFDAATGGAVTSQVARAFNGFGQTVTEWQSHTGVVNTLTTPKVEYTYSEGVGGNHSRLTSTVYPDGYTVNVTYTGIDSAVSRPTSLTGQRADSSTVATLEAFKYLGLVTVIERDRPEVSKMFSLLGTPGDAGDQYAGLDRFGRVVAHNWFEGSSSTIADGYGYTYDRNSNRLTRSNALESDFDETYTNDDLNQLAGYVRGDTGTPAMTQDWEFDALGNWTTFSTDGVAEAREANAQNELTDVGGASLAYSATGNLTTDADGNTFVYDAWNRLVAAYNVSTDLVARYEYDGLNRRIVEQVGTLADPDATTAPIRDLFYSLQWRVLEERVRDGMGDIPAEADTRFIWSPVYVDAMIARDRDADANTGTGTGGLEERVYALQDANWNTTAIIAAAGVSGASTGDVVNRFVYTPYGVHEVLDASWDALTSAPATPWSHLFQGLELTEVTSLFYVRHRDYSASLGRFIERDPIGFDAGDNNWYRFVGNLPPGRVDPSGLCDRGKTEILVHSAKPVGMYGRWTMFDGTSMTTTLATGLPDASDFGQALVDTVVQYASSAVGSLSSFLIVAAQRLAGSVTGTTEMSKKFFVTDISVDLVLSVNVTERRCIATTEPCWFGLLSCDTGKSHWEETPKAINVTVTAATHSFRGHLEITAYTELKRGFDALGNKLKAFNGRDILERTIAAVQESSPDAAVRAAPQRDK